MPSTRSIPSTSQPLPISTQKDFNIPPNNHLLITTPSRILSWDEAGLHTLFTSSKSGIAAATESKDGTGILAVADKHIVVLHDTKRGQEKSWGLTADEDEVRHLAYTTDSKSLFLSTKITNAVQCYSTQRKRLLSPPQMLASPPVALALSPTGHLMLSAEGNPAVIYLKDLVQNTAPMMLLPQGSDKAVAVAAFHPQRPNVFLLAFVDGTLAVYDAGRLSRLGGDGTYVDQRRMGNAEIGRIDGLHQPTLARTSRKPKAIAGAAFLPGHKSRVVSVGSDGKCKLVDFADGGVILRAWHCKVPLTCVSVFAASDARTNSVSTSKGKDKAAEPFVGAVISIGSEDGRVLLYDSLGLLQARKKANETGERIISVEWIAGPSPRAITSPALSSRLQSSLMSDTLWQRSRRKATLPTIRSSTPGHLRQHPALRPPTLEPQSPSQQTPRRFTVHPDEVEDERTVCHTPSGSKQPNQVLNEAGPCLDLFSPVNPFRVAEARKQKANIAQSPRARPRISSQTFAKDPVLVAESTRLAQDLNLGAAESHATSSDSRRLTTTGPRGVQTKIRRASTRHSPIRTERRKASARSPTRRAFNQDEPLQAVDPTAAANARLLRDLRQMNASSVTAHVGSILQGYASKSAPSTQPVATQPNTQSTEAVPITKQTQLPKTEPSSTRQIKDSHIYGRDGRWLTDSVSDDSWPGRSDDDIWITSDEEHREAATRRHHLFRESHDRPPARQTSRSRMASRGTVSTVNPAPNTAPAQDSTQHVISPDEITTARSTFSADGTFSPASEDVRSLFPRASSLSPVKKHRAPKKQLKPSPWKQERVLQDMSANTLLTRQPSSPWARAKKAKGIPVDETVPRHGRGTLRVLVDPFPQANHAHPKDTVHTCCAAATSRVGALEQEVAHMKGEILALKAVLRRNGIPAPTITRR